MPVEKLVRDRIPELMPTCRFRVAHDGERNTLLRRALLEQVDVYVAGGELESLADIVELVHELAAEAGVSPDTLNAHRRAKRLSKGGFDRGYVLELRG